MWNRESTSPRWQLEAVARGHHWLPTFWWGDLGQAWDRRAESYYRPAIDEARRRRLPIALVSTQWERAIYERSPWKHARREESALEFGVDGRPLAKLSPFGAVEPWSEVGVAWAATPILERLQRLYPDPPYVVLLSNNEAKKLAQREVELSLRYRKRFGAGRSEEFRRRVMGDGYIERYRALVEGIRSGLTAWRDRAIIIGWGGTSVSFGRGNWLHGDPPNFGLTVPGRLNVTPFAWDGISVKYYVDPTYRGRSADHTLFSPVVEIMNLPLEMEFACRHKPDYYWEMTTWFDPSFLERVREEGQPLPIDRYGGFLRLGMWIARPRAVREFSYLRQTLRDFLPHLEQVMRAVDEVHEDPVLASFWRSSELIPNRERPHPYRSDIPPEYADVVRWAALSTDLDPAGRWSLGSEVPVWALARVQRRGGSSRWLLFIQSPRGPRPAVRVRVPGLGTVPVRATSRGCYYLVEGPGQAPRSLAVNPADCALATAAEGAARRPAPAIR